MLCIQSHWTWAIPQTICIENISWPSRVSGEWWGQVLTFHLHLSFNQKLRTFSKNLVLFRPQEPENLFLHLQKLSTQGVVIYKDPISFWGRFEGLRNCNCLCSCGVLFHQRHVCRYKLAILFSDRFFLLPHFYISTHLLYMWIQLLCDAARLRAFPCYLAVTVLPSVSLHTVIVAFVFFLCCLLDWQRSAFFCFICNLPPQDSGVDSNWQQEPFSSL